MQHYIRKNYEAIIDFFMKKYIGLIIVFVFMFFGVSQVMAETLQCAPKGTVISKYPAGQGVPKLGDDCSDIYECDKKDGSVGTYYKRGGKINSSRFLSNSSNCFFS